MTGGGGGGDAPLAPACSGGEFLLSLLQKPQQQPQAPPHQFPAGNPPQQPCLPNDPAVAAVGPTINYPPQWPSNGCDLPPPWPHTLSPPFPHSFLGFPQNPWPSQSSVNQQRLLADDFERLGLSVTNYAIPNRVQQPNHREQLQQQGLLFGSFQSQNQPESLRNFNPLDKLKYSYPNGLDRLDRQPDPPASSISNLKSIQLTNLVNSREHDLRHGTQHYGSTPPPGFSNKERGQRGRVNSIMGFEHNVDSSYRYTSSTVEDGRLLQRDNGGGITRQLDHPGPPSGSNLHSASASDIEQSLLLLHRGDRERHLELATRRGNGPGYSQGDDDMDDFGEELLDSSLPEYESNHKNDNHERNDKYHRSSRDKDFRSDSRGTRLINQRMRNLKWKMECRGDIARLNASFLAIYESLIPAEEEKAKQKQLLSLLEKLVCKEWPDARLYLYGSCASSFGVSKSDIDVCLAINNTEINKPEILLKLADILQSDNLQNVQALTRARVPIVKLKDPVTGISCDICINNLLAVVNTKLLRDYAQVDVRLRQLAFIVKHWAKSRGVNETYHGTLSSYAYVLMCIHFLQQRRPAILPCLQGMEKTYYVTVDDIECAYFDQVEKLHGFGSRNKETIAQLVWGFFNYWAYGHDYSSSVISVRRGSIISKLEKDWTRRIGNDRHLICIEDPFEITHDLGRVVDKFSIKVIREEFERAAEILQYDPNPCVRLFEPYVTS